MNAFTYSYVYIEKSYFSSTYDHYFGIIVCSTLLDKRTTITGHLIYSSSYDYLCLFNHLSKLGNCQWASCGPQDWLVHVIVEQQVRMSSSGCDDEVKAWVGATGILMLYGLYIYNGSLYTSRSLSMYTQSVEKKEKKRRRFEPGLTLTWIVLFRIDNVKEELKHCLFRLAVIHVFMHWP
jgi:hypothetical protein